MRTEPDYRSGDDAATNDGRVTAWGLADVAFELHTANLIAFMDKLPPTPLGSVLRDKLADKIAARLGLHEEGWDETE